MPELYFFPKGQKAKLFEREHGKPIQFGDYLKGYKKNIETRLLDNQLYLSKSSTSKIEYLNEVYKYLFIHYCDPVISINYIYGFEADVDQSDFKDSTMKKNMLELLKAADTGGFNVIIDELDKSLHPLLTRMIIQIFHSKKNGI